MYPAKAIFSVISISLVHQWAKAFNIKRDVISINNTQQTTWKSLPTANQSYIRRLSVPVTFHQSETSSLRYNACFSIKRAFLICLNLASTKVSSNLTLRRTSSVNGWVVLILPIAECTLHSWSHSLRSLIIALSLWLLLWLSRPTNAMQFFFDDPVNCESWHFISSYLDTSQCLCSLGHHLVGPAFHSNTLTVL